MDADGANGKRSWVDDVAQVGRNGLGARRRKLWEDERGQGTTEYAILVGVLVVIAIVAIVAFRGRVAELWQAITDGINSL